MKTHVKKFLFASFIVILAGLGVVFAISKDRTKISGLVGTKEGEVAGAVSAEGDKYLERLADHLRDNGMVLYGSYQSTETKTQKDLFGRAAESLDYVECDASAAGAVSDECVARGIDIYPTWIFDGRLYKGVQTLSDLAKISNFGQ